MIIKTLLMQNMCSAHNLSALFNTMQKNMISHRLQRCCHHAFADHMPAGIE
jgi:hypothetical protein